MSEKKLPYDLEVLRQDADSLCNQAYDHGDISGPINWGDLGCTSAERRENQWGFVYYCVTVEEADPRAVELTRFIAEGLSRLGYDNVHVECEW